MRPPEEVGHLDALLFDLDGTLVDNMRMHTEAFDVFNARHGLPPLDEAMRERIDGKRNRDIFPILFDRAFDPDEWRPHAMEKESIYRELSTGRLTPLPGLTELLDRLEEDSIPYGIATSAPAENVEHTLNELGLRDRFRVVARSDEVARGKPYPDVFLAAAERLEVAATRCMAFEDALLGLEAIAAAGMKAAALTTSLAAERLAEHVPEERVIEDFRPVLAAPALFGLTTDGSHS